MVQDRGHRGRCLVAPGWADGEDQGQGLRYQEEPVSEASSALIYTVDVVLLVQARQSCAACGSMRQGSFPMHGMGDDHEQAKAWALATLRDSLVRENWSRSGDRLWCPTCASTRTTS
jgi:hypothetical protein